MLIPIASAMLLVVMAIAPISATANVKYRTFGDASITESPAGTFTIVVGAGQYGGVYLNSKSNSGKAIGDVSFSFTAGGSIEGGAPRFSLPINATGTDNSVEYYAFIDRNSCGGAALVSTDSATCVVYAGIEVFTNWAAFAAAHPTYRIAPGSIPFMISDVPGTYVVSDFVLR